MPTHSIGIGRASRADHLFARGCSRPAGVACRRGCWCLSSGAPGGVVSVMGEARRLLPRPPCALGGHPCRLRAAGRCRDEGGGGEMPGVLPGVQRDVASALPGCGCHDPASFGLERRRVFQRKWLGADRAGTRMAVSPSPRTRTGPGLPVMERLARVILGSRGILAAGRPANPRLDPASRPAVNQEGHHGRGSPRRSQPRGDCAATWRHLPALGPGRASWSFMTPSA